MNHLTPTRRRAATLLILAALAAAVTFALAAQTSRSIPVNAITRLVPEIIEVRPHDPNAFTQGLLLYNGSLYESTGQYGESDLREVDPVTGDVLRSVPLDDSFFAEGLALVNEQFLIQLTWRENTAFVYDLATFERLGTFAYPEEGWGLCYDGELLYHTDGSEYVMLRDPLTFQRVGRYPVTIDGVPVTRLNELECVGDHLYANVWQTDRILRFDKATGVVDAVIDATTLRDYMESEFPATRIDVLNGIAYDAENDVYLVTGKWWPALFVVRFVEDSLEVTLEP
ncbi:glutaminyl-peptide cyclotransferase [bacterium]|nr:glutaminyl-peptide cyclotransferase [bacterium]